MEEQHMEERGMSILLRYQGPAVDDGTMNVYDAAANMIAFSNFVVAGAHKLYGDDVEVTAAIAAFKHASFGTDLLFQISNAGAALLPILPNVVSVATTVKESIELYRFLKGEDPAKVEHINDYSINVTNNSGSIIVVNTAALHLTLDRKAGEAAAQFIGAALAKPGVNQIEISADGAKLVEASKEESQFYHPIGEEEILTESTSRMGLVIESLSFKDGNKWKMWNGSETLGYTMDDEVFNQRVNNGEAFRKGDILYCDVRVTQTKSSGILKLRRAIVKVHDHKTGSNEATLDLGLPD